jgi:hypothetical protein
VLLLTESLDTLSRKDIDLLRISIQLKLNLDALKFFGSILDWLRIDLTSFKTLIMSLIWLLHSLTVEFANEGFFDFFTVPLSVQSFRAACWSNLAGSEAIFLTSVDNDLTSFKFIGFHFLDILIFINFMCL